MNVIFLGQERNLQPWYGDVLAATAGAVNIHLYERGSSLASQFEGIGAVVDQGGVVGTREMVDLAAKQGVRLWQVLGTGLDHVDVGYILSKGLVLCNTPGQFSAIALAEHAMFQMLFLAKNYPAAQRSIRERVLCSPMVDELAGKSLALVGFGASARELATRAKAFGMRIRAVDVRRPGEEELARYGIEWFGGTDQLDDVLAVSDYVSLHIPLTSQTRHLLDARRIAVMKTRAVLINVARGGIVDEDALLDALNSGHLAGAALDVFAEEPVDPAHPLLAHPAVLATPHLAGVTTGTSRRRAAAVAENLVRVARGEEPQWRIFTEE